MQPDIVSGRACAIPLVIYAAVLFAAAAASSAAPAAGTNHTDTLVFFLSKNCFQCHSQKHRVANLNLEEKSLPTSIWAKVLDKVGSGRMPPAGWPRPSKAEILAVTRWIEAMVGVGPAGPGQVTARRLNRAEYNNTVRDLLGVSLRAADEFPLDDAGYGFDNIGDVLSVSPLLMEKYIAAARRISRAVIYGESVPPRPTKLIRFMSKKSQDDPTPNALPYSYRGAMYGSFHLPVTGEYEFRMRVGNYRPRDVGTPRYRELSHKRNLTAAERRELTELNRTAYPPVRMVMTVDGKQLLTTVVEGNIDYDYAHGETITRVSLTAGEHSFRASFPEFADLADVRTNVNVDGRRKLFIDYVDIVGPFHRAADPLDSRKRLFVCGQDTHDCTRRIAETLATRAYRRRVSPEEVSRLAKLGAQVHENGDSLEESVRVMLQAVLVSPNFLFRVEHEPANDHAHRVYAVTDYELASRLSYFLWSSMPDPELMQIADEGKLRKPEVLDAQVRRMLADVKSDALVENFFGQWLGLRLLDRRRPSPTHFTSVDDELVEAMRQETRLFASAIVREDRSILDLIDAPFSFLNGPLAHHYATPGIKGEAFTRVEFASGERGGVVSQGSVLTLSSYATRTSPVLRGKWVLETLLGTPPPPPPPDIPALKETNIGIDVSLRKRLEEHRANASCAVCHDQMDAIGFGLENYDASGAWRTHDGKFAIDASGTLPGGRYFSGPEELKRLLRLESDVFVRNLTERMLTYALGRGVESADRVSIDGIVDRLRGGGYRFSVLVNEIVRSQPFQMRERLQHGQGGKIESR